MLGLVRSGGKGKEARHFLSSQIIESSVIAVFVVSVSIVDPVLVASEVFVARDRNGSENKSRKDK